MSLQSVSVWSPCRLHADALVEVLGAQGLSTSRVDDPADEQQLLVAEVLREGDRLVSERRASGRATIVWGGTLLPPRVAALRAQGAAAYVSMLCTPSDLAEVVRAVLDGVQDGQDVQIAPPVSLTVRESEVARAYLVTWADRRRSEVAQRLGISERTLKAHIANIRAKTGHQGTGTRLSLLRALTLQGWRG